MKPKRHYKFRCPFCYRKIDNKQMKRSCCCGYWIRPITKDEIEESDKQKELLSNTKSSYICQESWKELYQKE